LYNLGIEKGVVPKASRWHDSTNDDRWKPVRPAKSATGGRSGGILRIETAGVEGKTTTRKEKWPMKSYVFRVVVEEDTTASGQEAYHAYCPALKGCHTWGRTYDEAFANVREAVELYIDDLREAGEAVPLDPERGAFEWPTPAVAVNV
jgi:predicted RNase H-like HicB family nuclease